MVGASWSLLEGARVPHCRGLPAAVPTSAGGKRSFYPALVSQLIKSGTENGVEMTLALPEDKTKRCTMTLKQLKEIKEYLWVRVVLLSLLMISVRALEMCVHLIEGERCKGGG